MYPFISGAIMAFCWVLGILFLRFWKRTHDRLFAFFAVSFFILGLERFALALKDTPNEARPSIYLMRLSGFLLILWAIVDKNRRESSE